MRITGRSGAVTLALASALALGPVFPGGAAVAAAFPHHPHPYDLRLNQIQVVGSHNSYHDEAPPAEEQIRSAFDPAGEKALEYDQPKLAVQLRRQHVRQLELDVWADPDGGRYANPLLRAVAQGGPYDPVMNEPGTKVFHIQEIDYHSTCLTFVQCLREVNAGPTAPPVTCRSPSTSSSRTRRCRSPDCR
jgi:Phosphoinositide phospholipase C, Ca2+-dependent